MGFVFSLDPSNHSHLAAQARQTPVVPSEEAIVVGVESTKVAVGESGAAELVSAGCFEPAAVLKSAPAHDVVGATESVRALAPPEEVKVPVMDVYVGGIEEVKVEKETVSLSLFGVSVGSTATDPNLIL